MSISGFLGGAGAMVRNPPAHAGQARDMGSIPGLGRSPGGRKGSPPQHSCLGNLTDREAWGAIVPGVAKSQTWLSGWVHMRVHTSISQPIVKSILFLSLVTQSEAVSGNKRIKYQSITPVLQLLLRLGKKYDRCVSWAANTLHIYIWRLWPSLWKYEFQTSW